MTGPINLGNPSEFTMHEPPISSWDLSRLKIAGCQPAAAAGRPKAAPARHFAGKGMFRLAAQGGASRGAGSHDKLLQSTPEAGRAAAKRGRARPMKRVLVSGGAGYIGSHACKKLARHGIEPIVYDSLVTGHRRAVKWGPLVVGILLIGGAWSKRSRPIGPTP